MERERNWVNFYKTKRTLFMFLCGTAVAGWQARASFSRNILNIQHFFSVRECEKFIIPKRINFSNACDSMWKEYLCWLLYHGSKSTTNTNKCCCIVFVRIYKQREQGEEICQICNHYTVYELFACLFRMRRYVWISLGNWLLQKNLCLVFEFSSFEATQSYYHDICCVYTFNM